MIGSVGDSTVGITSRLLHVRRSEMDRTFQMAMLAVVLGWGMMTGFNATQAIFLTRAGVKALPVFFIYLALSVWPMAALLGKLSQRVGVHSAFRQVLLINAFAAVFLYVIYATAETGPLSLAAYVIYSVAFEMVMLQFWSLVGEHFNLLEGKRIFPIVAAGSSVGYILAGVTTSYVASAWATEPLMFVWAAGTLLAAVMVFRLEGRMARPAPTSGADEAFAAAAAERNQAGPLASLAASLKFLFTSRLVAALVVAALLALVLLRVSDYVVAVVFVRSSTSLQELTVLIGNAWSISYLVQLVLGLALTPWLMARAGVKNAILVLPAVLGVGFAALALNPGLAAALLLFVVRNGVATGIDEPVQNVLATALPDQLRPPLRQILDDLVLPVSAVLTGVALLIVQARVPATAGTVLACAGVAGALLLLLAVLSVRSRYLAAVYERLRTHTLSLSDLEQAIGEPSDAHLHQIAGFLSDSDPRVRTFAAAAMARLAPVRFAAHAPELAVSPDAGLRRLAFQLAPAGALPPHLFEQARNDPSPWVAAAAAVAGHALDPPWPQVGDLLSQLEQSANEEAAAAAVWAAALVADDARVVAGLKDSRARVRLEAIRSFAKLKGHVRGAAVPLTECLCDTHPEVRREALRQAIRWSPPATGEERFESALIECLSSSDGSTRRLAAEALAVQHPGALDRSLPLLRVNNEAGEATIEALLRSGRAELVHEAELHLVRLLEGGLEAAQAVSRIRVLARTQPAVASDARFATLRLALENYVSHVIEMSFAGLRAYHGKRGFGTIERGLRSDRAEARAEALETLLNFGPAWLVEPLVQLLDPESFETGTERPLSGEEIGLLEHHPDSWVQQSAELLRESVGDSVKDLLALGRVPLFAGLSLEQLASIDRLMISRRYPSGETIFRAGEMVPELFVLLEGEVRIHRDQPGRRVTLARLGPGSFMGEMALFEERPRSASAETLSDSTFRILRQDHLDMVVRDHPEILLEVVRNLSMRLRAAAAQVSAAPPPAAPGSPSL